MLVVRCVRFPLPKRPEYNSVFSASWAWIAVILARSRIKTLGLDTSQAAGQHSTRSWSPYSHWVSHTSHWESYASYESYLKYPGFCCHIPSPSGIHLKSKNDAWIRALYFGAFANPSPCAVRGFSGRWSSAQLGRGAKVAGDMVEIRGWALWVACLPSTNNMYANRVWRDSW